MSARGGLPPFVVTPHADVVVTDDGLREEARATLRERGAETVLAPVVGPRPRRARDAAPAGTR